MHSQSKPGRLGAQQNTAAAPEGDLQVNPRHKLLLVAGARRAVRCGGAWVHSMLHSRVHLRSKCGLGGTSEGGQQMRARRMSAWGLALVGSKAGCLCSSCNEWRLAGAPASAPLRTRHRQRPPRCCRRLRMGRGAGQCSSADVTRKCGCGDPVSSDTSPPAHLRSPLPSASAPRLHSRQRLCPHPAHPRPSPT